MYRQTIARENSLGWGSTFSECVRNVTASLREPRGIGLEPYVHDSADAVIVRAVVARVKSRAFNLIAEGIKTEV